jgi:hypothetical protein
VLNLALSTLAARQRRALAAPALDVLARAVDRLTGTPGPLANQEPSQP